MNGMRLRPAGLSGRFVLGMLSSLALLALALPVAAQATDAAGLQYKDATPSPYGENPPPKEKHQANASKAKPDGGASAPSSNDPTGSNPSGMGSSQEDSSSTGAGGSPGKGDGGKGEGSPGAGSAASSTLPAQSGAPAASQQDDEGSSPLIPILAGILVLAAISIAVVIKQRRQGGGPPSSISPEAS